MRSQRSRLDAQLVSSCPQRGVLLDRGDPEAVYPAQPVIARLGAVLAQRCPVCLAGPMFRGVRELNEKCPRCGHHLLRSSDFRGGAALYARLLIGKLALAAAFIGLLLLFRRTWPDAELAVVVGAAFFVELVLVPAVYRYARVISAHCSVVARTR
jgi:uncharacterized protein (DUF983 family)